MDQADFVISSDELFHDINAHLITDCFPSKYLSHIINEPEFKQHPFRLLYELQFTEQSPVYHAEGNVWNHTLLVVDEAAKRKNLCKNPTIFMWAALLHDIGKPSTTKISRGKITAYNHDKVGAKLAHDFLSHFTKDKYFIENICSLIEFHMQILYVVKNLPYANVALMLKKSDYNEIALLGLCDRLGRLGASPKEEENNIKQFIRKCKSFERK
jgi:putative nucleotidyltransferase with HDIG domain